MIWGRRKMTDEEHSCQPHRHHVPTPESVEAEVHLIYVSVVKMSVRGRCSGCQAIVHLIYQIDDPHLAFWIQSREAKPS
jgi:hypothetical protein